MPSAPPMRLAGQLAQTSPPPRGGPHARSCPCLHRSWRSTRPCPHLFRPQVRYVNRCAVTVRKDSAWRPVMSTHTLHGTGTPVPSRREPLARQAEAGERRPVADGYELADSLVRAEGRRRRRVEGRTEVIEDRQ